MMMTNGFGAVFGSYAAGWAIDKFFTHKFTTASSLANYLETTPDNQTFLGILKKFQFCGKSGRNVIFYCNGKRLA
jgi:NHS family xanthosine MFS transporter